jgi:hypothetical protein
MAASHQLKRWCAGWFSQRDGGASDIVPTVVISERINQAKAESDKNVRFDSDEVGTRSSNQLSSLEISVVVGATAGIERSTTVWTLMVSTEIYCSRECRPADAA